ncbi:MAG: Crp/Fnr family transcriptional regulator, partial [Geovibrio sp.]|nr:Crp/Fnr family transcriptional regulator [Geovibrio sp.]
SGYHSHSKACIGSTLDFQNLSPDEKSSLASFAVRKEYKKGEVVFSQGDTADQMFLIKAGLVKISKVSENGSEMILDIRKMGDFMGEQIFWDDFEYPGTAVCVEDSFICTFSKNAFEKLVLSNPNIGLNVVKNLSKHIEFLSSRNCYLLIRDLKEKLYNLLLNIGNEHGTNHSDHFEINIHLSHEELGFLLGAHRVSITKTMKALRKTGLVKKEGKTLYVYRS